MSDAVAKGEAALAAAMKKLKSLGWFGNKNEEAAELLEKASNYFKLGKAWKEAAATYEQLAEVHLKLDSKHEAATAYVEAAKCAMKLQPGDGVVMLKKAVDIYTDMGRLNMAARQLKEIAEAQEKQGLKEEAMQFYTQAADLFATENSTSEATKCTIKVAEFAAELDRFEEAVGIYEEAARAATENNLLKFSAKGYLLQAGICIMCYASDDEVQNKFDLYRDIDLQFAGSREETLLSSCAEALAQCEEKRFATAIAEFDALTRLDAWKTNMLLRVKRRLQARAAGEEQNGDEDEELL